MEEVGTFKELSSDPTSRFSAFLKTMAETSTSAIDQVPSDTDAAELDDEDGEDDSSNASGASEDALDYGGDEPEVTKIIHTAPKRSISRSLSRQISRRGSEDSTKENGEDSGALMTDEFKEREKGSVDNQVYLDWAKAGGGVYVGISVLTLFVVVEIMNVTSKWWLTHWSQGGGSNTFFYLGIYALINFSAIITTFCRLLIFVSAGLRASRSMFVQLLDVVLEAPMAFFDT